MRTKSGFTLIELLVVIAIIALLLSILIPSLTLVKRKAAGIVCLSNERQLSIAWAMFASEHDDEIVDGQPDNDGDGVTDYGKYGVHPNFVSNPIAPPTGGDPFKMEGRILGLKKGGLWTYLENYKVFHCPADIRTVKDELRYGYRTYSIGAVYSLMAAKITTTGEEEVFVTKTIKINQPAEKIVWLEEMDVQQEYNDNTWNVFLHSGSPEWFDPVAVWHGDSSTFGFADGHADRHKWIGELVRERSNFEKAIELLADGRTQKRSGILTDPKDIEDWSWLKQHYIPAGNVSK